MILLKEYFLPWHHASLIASEGAFAALSIGDSKFHLRSFVHYMDPFQGVFIEVVRESQELELYDNPKQDIDHDPLHYQCYIEAISDAKFAVKVIFTRDYPLPTFHPNEAIRITISYDGDPVHWFNELSSDFMHTQWREKGIVEHVFSHVSSFDPRTQQWSRGATGFGVLNISIAPILDACGTF